MNDYLRNGYNPEETDFGEDGLVCNVQASAMDKEIETKYVWTFPRHCPPSSLRNTRSIDWYCSGIRRHLITPMQFGTNHLNKPAEAI